MKNNGLYARTIRCGLDCVPIEQVVQNLQTRNTPKSAPAFFIYVPPNL